MFWSKPRAAESKEYDYSGLPEMASIITNNDTEAIGAITLLSSDFAAFLAVHAQWCEGMDRAKTMTD